MMKTILYFAIWVMTLLQSFNMLWLYPLDIANITCEETPDIIIDCTGQGLPYVQAFPENSSHQAVILSHNRLTNLDTGIFDGLIKLTILNLDVNNLSSLHHDIFRSLSKLTILRLESNQIKELEISIFDPLKSLEDLFLHNNLIRSLNTGIFHSLPNLLTLTLNDNQLQCLPDQIFASSHNLMYLLLQNNQLIRLDVNIFASISNPLMFYKSSEGDVTWLFGARVKCIACPCNEVYLPVMCNCTENRLRLIPYVTTRMFTVQIRVDKTDYTTDWITRTNTCNSTMIDSPYCNEISEIIEECVAEEPESHFTTSQGFEETTRYVTEGNERHVSLDEGTLYTVVASIIGGLASAVVLYQLYSRIQIFATIMRTRNVTESQLENVVEEVLNAEYDGNDEYTRHENVPPISHMYIVYLSPGGNPEYRNMTNTDVRYNPFRRGVR